MATKFSLDQINVESLRAYYDSSTKTKVTETNNLLQYESQHFRCTARVRTFESFADSNWTLGLIQACDRMYLENRYGTQGSSFWEFHPLKSGCHKMVNDSDGRQYPFYSISNSKCEIPSGNVREKVYNLFYEDHFYPTVAWHLPYCGGARLTDVIRKQDFWVWLVAIKRLDGHASKYNRFRPNEDRLFVLKTIRWRYNLHMQFDPHLPVGKRLKSIEDHQSELPIISDFMKPVPLSAVSPPHCNAAQSLVWYPSNSTEKAKILVPPKQIIVPWDVWQHDMFPSPAKASVVKPTVSKVVVEWRRRDDELHTTKARPRALTMGRLRGAKRGVGNASAVCTSSNVDL